MLLTDILNNLKLNKKESLVYLNLLQTGASRASVLAYQLDLPRTTVQNILKKLEEQNFISRKKSANTFIYEAEHPENLVKIVEMEKKKMINKFDYTIEELKKFTPQLMGIMHKTKVPGIQLYEGKEAIAQVLFDTLSSKTNLKDFANIDAMFEHAKDINDAYVAEREKTTLKKQSLLLDTPFARKVYEGGKYSPTSHTGYKWLKNNIYPFALEMNIYDGKVSYITYVENNFIGVIIENDQIYQMHDSMWNLIWDLLPFSGEKHSKESL